MEKPIADVYLAKWHANFFYLSKSPLKKFFACEIAITNYYDMSNYYDVRITFLPRLRPFPSTVLARVARDSAVGPKKNTLPNRQFAHGHPTDV